MLTRCVVVGLVLTVTAACSSGTVTAPQTTPTAPIPGRPTVATAPTPTGPTAVAKAAKCPWVATSVVYFKLGQRLGRITVLRSDGKVVGCRFYALSKPNKQCGPVCFKGENLPGPNQPVMEVVTRPYANATEARNAYLLAARAGTGASKVTIRAGLAGATYRTRFDPSDGAQDSACGFSIGSTQVLLRIDQDEGGSDGEALALAKVVARAL